MKCPKCESMKVNKMGKLFFFLMFAGVGSLCVLTGLLIPPLFVIGVVFTVLSPFTLFLPAVYACKSCNHVFKPDKKQNAAQ